MGGWEHLQQIHDSWQELVVESRVNEGNASRNIRVLQDLHLVQASNPMFTEQDRLR